MITSGKKKALIVIGHVLSEQSGMEVCAEWLKNFIEEVPIDFVPAAEPFWIRTDRPHSLTPGPAFGMPEFVGRQCRQTRIRLPDHPQPKRCLTSP